MKNKKGFTIIELVVVVTIISILGTIGFVSYSSYIADSRDTSRLSQISSIFKALEGYRTKGFLPIPSNKVNIYASGTLVAYQGYAGDDVLSAIGYQDNGVDPKDEFYFTYYLTKDLRTAQLMTLLENEVTVSYNLINQANALDYSDRVVKVYGNKLGILTESGTKVPIQELNNIISSGGLDVVKTTSTYTAYISDDNVITGTGRILAFLKDGAGKSCKDIIYKNPGRLGQDGIYYINPTGTGSFQVYCDMTTDGGGWTLVANIQGTGTTINSGSYLLGMGTPNLTDITVGNWIIDADLYDSIGQTIRVNMGTVIDYFKPAAGSNLKSMVMTYNKYIWSNSANGVFITPAYFSTYLGGSAASRPVNNNNSSGDKRQYLSFWGGTGSSGCCHESLTDTAAWNRKFRMWIR